MLKMMKGMLHSSSDRAALYLSPSRSAEFWLLLVVQHKSFSGISLVKLPGLMDDLNFHV